MHELAYLQDLIIIIGIAIVVSVIFHRFKLPAIAGLILSGILVGPKGFGLISDTNQVTLLAEIGVALLLFGIGLELALKKLKRLWKLALIGGILQVGITTIITIIICIQFELPFNSALFVGFLVALSSTAIVLQSLQQRGEVDAPHGKLILGILVFQDFSVVPMMLLIPLLFGSDVRADEFFLTFGKSIGIVLIVLLSAILIVPRLLKFVAQTKQRQLFILTVFVVCLGTAWMVTTSGASLAIGAFLAGLVVAGSEYRHQALADILSFREIFASLFFVSVGMLLSPTDFFDNFLPISVILIGILVGKSVIVFCTALLLRLPLRASIIAALALAQVGEFSFVLLYAVKGNSILSNTLESNILSAAILSMFITPFIISFGPTLAAGLGKFSRLKKLLDVDFVSEASSTVHKFSEHVIIAGYGFAGRELAMALHQHNIPFIIVDVNIDNVRKASQELGNAVFGDITSEDVLDQLSIVRAQELVVLINDPAAAEHTIRVARKLAPKLFITVRTAYLLDIDQLINAGANEVVTSEQEAAVHVASQVLKRHRVETIKITEQEKTIRDHDESDQD